MARSRLLGAMSFAHLLGRPAARAEDDKDDKKDKDKDEARKARAEEGDEDEETDDEKKRRREDEDKEDEERREEDEEDKEERRKREDEEDEADGKDAKATAARGRERARCASIFGSKHASARPDMAAHYAFATNLSATDARRSLAAVVAGQPKPQPQQAASRRSAMRDRMDGERSPNLGGGDSGGATADTPDGVARQCLAAAGLLPKQK